MKKSKKRMTADQEFEVLKLVLDKYLWLGTGIMIFGLYKIVIDPNIAQGVSLIITGTVLLLLFVWLIVREYEFLR
jgi:hypothetical protein